MIKRIHILGASGSGTTTLGRKLAERLNCTHLDTDNFFWEDTNPPFQQKRKVEHRQIKLREAIDANPSWVLTGSLTGWGDMFIPDFDLVVFLWLPEDVRLQRIKDRELEKFGAAIKKGGDMYETHKAFLEWAGLYDTGDVDIRSKKRHKLWLEELPCDVLKIEGDYELDNKIDMVLDTINKLNK